MGYNAKCFRPMYTRVFTDNNLTPLFHQINDNLSVVWVLRGGSSYGLNRRPGLVEADSYYIIKFDIV